MTDQIIAIYTPLILWKLKQPSYGGLILFIFFDPACHPGCHFLYTTGEEIAAGEDPTHSRVRQGHLGIQLSTYKAHWAWQPFINHKLGSHALTKISYTPVLDLQTCKRLRRLIDIIDKTKFHVLALT